MKDNILSELVKCKHINVINNFEVVTGLVRIAGALPAIFWKVYNSCQWEEWGKIRSGKLYHSLTLPLLSTL
jgi:hypothetical protein